MSGFDSINGGLRRMKGFKSHHGIRDFLDETVILFNLMARWHIESRTQENYEKAKEELRRYLENDSTSTDAAEAWHMLGRACYLTN